MTGIRETMIQILLMLDILERQEHSTIKLLRLSIQLLRILSRYKTFSNLGWQLMVREIRLIHSSETADQIVCMGQYMTGNFFQLMDIIDIFITPTLQVRLG